MFRYGLVGNTIIFGGGFGLLGYTTYELYKLSESSTKMSEDLARELFDSKEVLELKQEQVKEKDVPFTFSGKRLAERSAAQQQQPN